MSEITYVRGDATAPSAKGPRLIVHVCNDTGSKGVPVRYEAIAQGLAAVAGHAAELGASVHMPRIGCGLAGGTWSRVEPLIAEQLVARGIPVTVYDHEG
ncbi:hypothetical protein ABT127_39190 [Streptomyces sp. NPDC001904]|uniref:hypothetical protein n=1 Tax=Streptomyces sp. NPDC001904 TaxID=3154531 RepID=UPI00332962D3